MALSNWKEKIEIRKFEFDSDPETPTLRLSQNSFLSCPSPSMHESMYFTENEELDL
jgi:hypothetical protein